MIDREKIKEQLKEKLQKPSIDYDAIVDDMETKDGMYIFKHGNDAFIFVESVLIDVCPGYYASEGDGQY